MGTMKDETGNTYHRLTVLEQHPERKHRRVQWLCQCSCGNTTIVPGKHLRKGLTKSCGCLRDEGCMKSIHKATQAKRTHGMTNTPTYRAWQGMKARCYQQSNPGYSLYGGRGITICSQWRTSFEQFLADMGERPTDHPEEGPYSVDRKDNDGPYSPENCRWATGITQANNTRRNHRLTLNGETHTLTQGSRITGISAGCLRGRLHKMKWSVEKTLTTPTSHVGRPRKV